MLVHPYLCTCTCCSTLYHCSHTVYHSGRQVPGCGYALVSVHSTPVELHVEVLIVRENKMYTRTVSLTEAAQTAQHPELHGNSSYELHELAKELCNRMSVAGPCILFNA